jgi:MerR family mercuric resistance operon transcriptional regulator
MKRRPADSSAVVSIGTLSRRSRCNIETIRYYERIGLIPEPPRTAGGHRCYGKAHERRLRFIRRCRELEFSIEEIRVLLGLVDSGDYTCGEVKSVTDQHLDYVRAKIAGLKSLERSLKNISATCQGGQVPVCPIVDSLFQDAETNVRQNFNSS